MFRVALFALLQVQSLAQAVQHEITASSSAGKRLLSSARRLSEDAVDLSWLAGYSLQFRSCSSLLSVGERGGGEEGNNLYMQQLVEFALCPTGSCSYGKACSGGGIYVTEMREFVEAYTEFQMEVQEYQCEQVRENCVCNDDVDDEACEYQCYMNKGMEYCIENDDEDDFEVQRYLECRDLEDKNDDDSAQQYYVGPYCSSDGKAIYLGTFKDGGCINMAPSGTYYNLFGSYLPYSSQSLVKEDCVSCLEPQDENEQNQDDQQDADEVIELCEEVYERSAKCEKDMYVDNPDNNGCSYINDMLPRLVKVTNGSRSGGGGGGGAAKFFAWFWFFTTAGLVFVIYKLYQNRARTKIDLSGFGGESAMA